MKTFQTSAIEYCAGGIEAGSIIFLQGLLEHGKYKKEQFCPANPS